MSKFQPISVYEKTLASGYRLLPFNFTRLEQDDFVLTNAVGEFVVLPRPALEQFVRRKLATDHSSYGLLKSKHFLIDDDSSVAFDLLALKTRTKLRQLENFTSLHIFVVTLRCEHSCPYCQVSRQSDDRLAFDMSTETADQALALVFKSSSAAIKIEFQGGEPLLNFTLIQYIVQRAEEINEHQQRDLQFVIATNLAVVTDEILGYCKDHMILISTSLDGPEDIHNKNRPRPGRNSHQLAISGIQRARKILGDDRVSALMTTTAASLPRVRDIIDEYVRLDFHGIFLRPISPYGFAMKTKTFKAYDREAWLRFYVEGLDYIININKKGQRFVEHYSAVVLTKMLTPSSPGYVDLMSPAGIGIAVLVYNYDGDVYASDESRMLAEMGDKTFRLGNVHKESYEEMLTSDSLLDPIEQSFAASAPMCSDCAFEPFCGSEPVYHHATQHDFLGRKPTSDFCHRNMYIFRHLIKLMRDDGDVRDIFRRWVS